MLDGYACIISQRSYVNPGFYQDARLPDPAHLLEGTGKEMRHVKIRSMTDADRATVRALIVAAVVERKSGTEDQHYRQ